MTREDLEELYEERAGILEHMGGWPKEKAEALAAAEVETIRRALKEGKEGAPQQNAAVNAWRFAS